MKTRRLVLALTAATFTCASVGPASAAPSKPERRAAPAQVLEQRLDALRNQVPTIESELAASATRARAAVAHYAEAMQQLGTVRAQAAASLAALAVANAALAHQRELLEDVARQAYIAGDSLTQVAIVLAGGSPTDIFDGMSLLGTMADTRTRVLDRYAAAQARQTAAAADAAAATARVEAITVGADTARRAAVVATANRHMQLGRVTATIVKTAQRIVHDAAAAPADAAGTNASGAATAAVSAGGSEPTTAPQPAPAPAPAPTDTSADKPTIAAAPTPEARGPSKSAKVTISVDALRASRREVLAQAWDSLRDLADKTPAASAKRGLRAVAWAKKQLGVPYSWGGGNADGPTTGVMMPHHRTIALHTTGFDCSGLVIYAWAHAGVTFDHYTGYQWFEGRQVSLDHLRPGDLVFFAHDTADPLTIHHVGIYVGDGQMIDAPHTGAVVRYDNVDQPGLIGAVRP